MENIIESYGIIFLICIFISLYYLYSKIKEYNRRIERKNKIQYASFINVEGSDDLKEHLKKLSSEDKIRFINRFVLRGDSSFMDDFYDIKISELNKQGAFNDYLRNNNLKFDNINKRITLTNFNKKSMTYKHLTNEEYTIKFDEINEAQFRKPIKSKLSGNLKYGY